MNQPDLFRGNEILKELDILDEDIESLQKAIKKKVETLKKLKKEFQAL